MLSIKCYLTFRYWYDPVDLIFERNELYSIYNTPQAVSHVLSALDVKNATGPDALGNIFLKNLLGRSLCLISLAIVSTGGFPKCSRASIIVLKHKEGDRGDVEN